VDLDEILYDVDDIDDHLDFILFNAVASTITRWRTFKLPRWVKCFNRFVGLDKILYGGGDIEYCSL
jgi:hypothetical protein